MRFCLRCDKQSGPDPGYKTFIRRRTKTFRQAVHEGDDDDHHDDPGTPRPLLATAAVLALATAVWLGAPLAASADDRVASVEHNHAAAAAVEAPAGVVDVVRDPTDLPGPIGARGPQHIKVNLETTEVTGELADGTT